jgi:glucosamine kinase
MILIADSGSTKTDWRFVNENGEIHQYKTTGFNPYFQTTGDIVKELTGSLVPAMSEEAHKPGLAVHFYGAGCSSEAKCKVVYEAIAEVFPRAKVNVEHDLLAAARALCGAGEGIAAILGTGSNSCYYDGKEIRDNVFSLGFILGDEGSGAYLGKKLLQCHLYRELPPELEEKFSSTYRHTREDILDSIYKKPLPSRFLASFSPFLQRNIHHPFISRLIYDGIDDFFRHHITKYDRHREVSFNCVGSVGYHYSDILKKVAGDRGIQVGNIIETPIAALTLYHTGIQQH